MTQPNLPSLQEIDLPAKGSTVSFNNGRATRWIRADQDEAWTVGNGGAWLAQFLRDGDEYFELDDDSGPGRRYSDWRLLVASLI